MSNNTLASLAGLHQIENHEDGPPSQAAHRVSRCTRRARQIMQNTSKNTTNNTSLHINLKSLNKLIASSHLILALIALSGANVGAQYFSAASGGGQLQQQPTTTSDANCNDPSHSHNLQQRQELNQQQTPLPMAYPLSLDLISQLQQQHQQANNKLAASEISSPLQNQQQAAPSGRSRSPRSIGDMFRKLFNTNKRSKQPSGSSSSSSSSGQQQANLNSRDWEQQQHSQQQQQQQQHFHQHNQQALAAAQLAAAAASQHAVFATPYGTANSPAALYAQNPYAAYSPTPAGLYAWPTANFQALRPASPPTLLTATGPQTGANPMAPMFAAASQSYTSYAPAPQSSNSNGNPQAAASHAHPSAVPAPVGMSASASSPALSGGPNMNSLDFHQVLDALVRTSGFAPAGDAEAAAAYGQKGSDGTHVFTFKKLLSMPFYFSSEDKSLDNLAPAAGQGYAMHSMPLMRRHVRRMSTVGQQTGSSGGSSSDNSPYYLPAESVASYRQYNNYINALNNQLAAMAASGNQQQQQYYNQQYLAAVAAANAQPGGALNGSQQSVVQQQAAPLDAMAAESALANYYATVNGASQKPSGIGNRDSSDRLAAVPSLVSTAVQPPSNMIARQQQQQQQLEQQQQRELQQLISMIGEAQSSKLATADHGQQLNWPSMSQAQVGEMSAFMNQLQQPSNTHQQHSEGQFQNYVSSSAKHADPSQQSASVASIGQHHKSTAASIEPTQTNAAASQQQQQQSSGQQQSDSMQTQSSNLVPQATHQTHSSALQSQQMDSEVQAQPLPSSADGVQQNLPVIITQTSGSSASPASANSSQNQPNLLNNNPAAAAAAAGLIHHHHHHHMQPSGTQTNLNQQQQQQQHQHQHQAMAFRA